MLLTLNQRSSKENKKLIAYGIAFVLVGLFLMSEGDEESKVASDQATTIESI
jgi:hypothetical protein